MPKLDENPLFQYLRETVSRRALAKEAICGEFRTNALPTSEAVKNLLPMFFGFDREEILSHHKFWKEHKLRNGLNALFATARAAYIDICKHQAAIPAIARHQSEFENNIDYAVTNPFQKDVMAFCAASAGVNDVMRRLYRQREDLEAQLKLAFNTHLVNDLANFIKQLRNNLAHGSIVIPGWTIEWSSSGTSGAMTLNTRELLLFGEWNGDSKRFIGSAEKETIYLGNAISDHQKSLQSFSNEVAAIFSKGMSDAEKDYFDLEDAQKLQSAKQYIHILLQQVQGNDPYQYLPRYFDGPTVRKILKYPQNSKEQVDYMIVLKSGSIECDDSLRLALYKLFQVQTPDNSNPPI